MAVYQHSLRVLCEVLVAGASRPSTSLLQSPRKSLRSRELFVVNNAERQRGCMCTVGVQVCEQSDSELNTLKSEPMKNMTKTKGGLRRK